MTPYKPRSITPQGVLEHLGWRIKRYLVSHDGARMPADRRCSGEAALLPLLPSPAITNTRPGVGFLIFHRGSGVDYAVLGYWDRDNELPLHVMVRYEADVAWRSARDGESVCVWDLQVIWHERNAFVDELLSETTSVDADGAVARYLSNMLEVVA